MRSKKEVFAKGYSGKKLFLIFVIGSILGAYYEEVLNIIRTYMATGSIIWEARRGVIYGPFSPIYGAGAALIVYFIGKPNYSNFKTFLYGAIIGGGFEYLISFLQEVFTNTVSWDYSTKFLNINGRTTVPFMIVWGLFCLIFVKVIYPFISNLIEKIPVKIGNYIYYFLFIFLVIDMLLSWTALIRGTLRRRNIKPLTDVGRFYDKVYPDEVLQEAFPNMTFKEVRK